MNDLVRTTDAGVIDACVSAACYGLADNSRLVYSRDIRRFLDWWTPQARPLDRLSVADYLTSAALSAPRHHQSLSAIKRLASQALEHGWLDWTAAQGIASLQSPKRRGVRAGVWLTKDQTTRMLDAPNAGTLRGLRDLAALSLLFGCGLRRSEVSALTVGHLKQLEGRQHIVNLKGKANRTRTVRVPEWAEVTINRWIEASGVARDGDHSPLLRSFRWDGSLNGSLSPTGVRDIVNRWSKAIGTKVAAHDLRRTFAKLARKGGAPLEVLQKTLGHASLTTTEKYVNAGEEANAGDYLQL